MGRINAAWHAAHPMPERATLDQRIAWHVAHAKACGCREIPVKVRDEMERRGMALSAAEISRRKATRGR